MPGTSESEKFICFSIEIDLPKMGILEVDKSKPIPKLAQDGNHKNFTKKGIAGFVAKGHPKVAHIFLKRSWAQVGPV